MYSFILIQVQAITLIPNILTVIIDCLQWMEIDTGDNTTCGYFKAQKKKKTTGLADEVP